MALPCRTTEGLSRLAKVRQALAPHRCRQADSRTRRVRRVRSVSSDTRKCKGPAKMGRVPPHPDVVIIDHPRAAHAGPETLRRLAGIIRLQRPAPAHTFLEDEESQGLVGPEAGGQLNRRSGHRTAILRASPANIDTDVVIAYLHAEEPLHTSCIPFFESIALSGGTERYVSSLLRLEFAHVVTREAFRTRPRESVRRQFRLDRGYHAPIRSA